MDLAEPAIVRLLQIQLLQSKVVFFSLGNGCFLTLKNKDAIIATIKQHFFFKTILYPSKKIILNGVKMVDNIPSGYINV